MRSEDDAQDDFGHLFNLVFEAVTEGVRDYFRDHPAVNHKHSMGTRRGATRDYIVDRLRAAIGGVSGIHISDKNQTVNFGIQSRYLGRVHKLCEKLSATLGHTQAALAFQDNDAEAALGEGFEEATCIRIGYVPLPADPMNPRIFITCPVGKQNAWKIELRRAEGAADVGIEPVEPLDPMPDETGDMVEVIRDPVRKGDEE